MSVDYTKMSGRNSSTPELFLRRKFEDRLVDILPLVIGGERVLEVGCAEGLLCQYLKIVRSVYYTGIEPSLDRKSASRYLDEVYTTVDEILDSNDYDLVLSFHTLEHIDDPLSALKKWKSLLKTDGRLIVEVPNGPGHPEICVDTNKEHINFFSPSTLSALFEQAGFELLRLTSGHFESPLYPDSIRAIARPSKSCGERLSRLLGRFQKIPTPVAIYGLGGDFVKFIVPNIKQLMPVEFLDLNPAQRTYSNITIFPREYDNSLHKELNIIVSTFKFEEEVRQKLLGHGHLEEKVFLLSRILLD